MLNFKTFTDVESTPFEAWKSLANRLFAYTYENPLHVFNINCRISPTDGESYLASAVISFKELNSDKTDRNSEIVLFLDGAKKESSDSEQEALKVLFSAIERYDLEDVQEITSFQYDIINWKENGVNKYFAYAVCVLEANNALRINKADLLKTLESSRLSLWGILKYGKSDGFSITSDLIPPDYEIEGYLTNYGSAL